MNMWMNFTKPAHAIGQESQRTCAYSWLNRISALEAKIDTEQQQTQHQHFLEK